MTELKPGTLVTGPFYADGRYGVGIVMARGRRLWTRTSEQYVPVRIIKGNRASGGYKPETLTAIRTDTRV